MSANNPATEIEDTFYNKSEAPELEQQTTDETDVTEQVDQLPDQDDEIIDSPDKIEIESKSDELENEDEVETTQYVEIDGKEISLDDIKKGLQSTFMQSDYTKKTTEHAQFVKKDREDFALERENLSKEKEEITGLRDKLTVLVAEDESIDWAELEEFDPEEYIKLKKVADARIAALDKVRIERETPADDPVFIESERKKFWDANPEWLDKDNKITDVQKADIAAMNKYVTNAGYSSDEFNKMTSARQLTTILKAAKYDELQGKGREITEKRISVPVVTKPRVKTTQPGKSMEEVFYN